MVKVLVLLINYFQNSTLHPNIILFNKLFGIMAVEVELILTLETIKGSVGGASKPN